ncbi:hypothetical protein BIU88_03475 [Chlorobaculum limnaeum]|uniref:Uncharacterized protein n=1 Tax=Chlorobaculum limnaeum TaxID=274537 RepID=A0A1D8D4H3_CHLLM|nr:ATP synthase subunit I [Chlorobaculum limnaeum]AOS83284.1 hypothetical protein BIU88_03475 [Chlorobaculum limnaeum]
MFEDDDLKWHNQGEKDAADGKDRSKPWPIPFESDESYQARCNAYDRGYFHTTGQVDGANLKWTKSTPTTRLFESETDKLRESAYRKGYESGARAPRSKGDSGINSDVTISNESTSSSYGSHSGHYSGISPKPFSTLIVIIYFGVIISYYLLWLVHPHPEKFLGGLIEAFINNCWSPTSDPVLNFFIDAIIIVVGIPIALALAGGILGTGIVLFLVFGVGWLLLKLASLSPFGAIVAIGISLGLLYGAFKWVRAR